MGLKIVGLVWLPACIIVLSLLMHLRVRLRLCAGLGLTFNAKAREHLAPGEENFFDPVLPNVANKIPARKFKGSRL